MTNIIKCNILYLESGRTEVPVRSLSLFKKEKNTWFPPTNEWTISKYYSRAAVYIFSSGWAGNDVSEPVTRVYDVRPTFFLNENVKITRGDGSYLNPFYLEL